MERVYFTGITAYGCCVQGVSVLLPEDYTMNQLVKAIKGYGYKAFMLDTMKRFVNI